MPDQAAEDRLMTPSEVAQMFRVDPKTVTRWAKSGKLTSIRTLGGHRRYPASEVQALLELHGVAGKGQQVVSSCPRCPYCTTCTSTRPGPDPRATSAGTTPR